jgi:hypothetical protein
VQGADALALDVRGHHGLEHAVVEHEHCGPPVELGEPPCVSPAELARDADQEARDAVRAEHQPARCPRPAATVAGEHHVGREQGQQRRRIVRGERVDEAADDPFMLARRGDDARPFAPNPRTRAVHQLAHGIGAPFEDACDLGVLRIENVAQQKGRALLRRESLEQD